MKSRWKNQFQVIENQSGFHELVRNIFTTDSFFRSLRCYQEVPVVDLVENYPNPRHRFDWYIEEISTIVELHGDQHYAVVNYGGIGYDEAVREFHRIRDRDHAKRVAAECAGYIYRVIPYRMKDKLDAKRFKQIILQGSFSDGT